MSKENFFFPEQTKNKLSLCESNDRCKCELQPNSSNTRVPAFNQEMSIVNTQCYLHYILPHGFS